MGYSKFDPAMQDREAWNAGKTVGPTRPLTQKQIWATGFSWIARAVCVTALFLIWRSIASFVAAIW